MKYSVEYMGSGKFRETLQVNGNTVFKTWQRKHGEISGLCSDDLEFSEQLKEVEDEDVLDYINDLFDSSMLVADVEDFIINTGVE